MPTAITGTGPQVVAQKLYSSSADQLHALGERVNTNDGRAFRYALAGGTTLVSGTLLQAKAETTANQNLTAVAAAIGDTSLVSTSTITCSANQYANGFAIITTSAGIGKIYKISGHAAFSAAAPTFTLSDPIEVALTTGSRIDLVENPYGSVIINPTTATSTPVGVAVAPIVTLQYGWIQTAGIAPCLADGTVTVGTDLVASNATAGAVEALTGVQAVVALAVTGIATTEVGAVKLLLD